MQNRVTKDMNIMDVVEKYPVVTEVLMRYGLGCAGCFISGMETLEDGIAIHGIDPDMVIEEVNMILEMIENGEYEEYGRY